MGAAKIIKLSDSNGESDEHSLELHRLEDGTIEFRVFEARRGAGISTPGSVSVWDMAGALAKSTELRIPTRSGYYTVRREHETVDIGYFVFSEGWRPAWKGRVSDVLAALKELSGRAA